jgi:hypothetical protein
LLQFRRGRLSLRLLRGIAALDEEVFFGWHDVLILDRAVLPS